MERKLSKQNSKRKIALLDESIPRRKKKREESLVVMCFEFLKIVKEINKSNEEYNKMRKRLSEDSL